MNMLSRRDVTRAMGGLGVASLFPAMFAGRVMGQPATGGGAGGAGGGAGVEKKADDAAWGPEFPQQPRSIAREFVTVCHFNPDRAKALLDKHPGLVHTAWDWGFGDWETGLGAASHMGRRDIAAMLIERGARVDLFAAAMLGWTEVVKAMVAASPGVQRAAGPHGITLLAHARAGKDASAETLKYLESLGDADVSAAKSAPLLAEEKHGAFVGTYVIDAEMRTKAGANEFKITSEKGQVMLRMEGGQPRNLFVCGEGVFFPVGVPSVRVTFEMDAKEGGGRARAVVVADGAISLRAVRKG